MRNLTVNTFITLDGVMQAPGGPEEDRSGGFSHGGWSVNFWDDVMGQAMTEAMSVPSDILIGRKTYEIFAAHWPYITNDPAAETMNNARKYVASRTLDRVDWNNSTLLKGDVAQEVAALKEQDGPEIQVQGSSDLIQTLLEHELVDEFRLWVSPVVVGRGKRLFGEGTVSSTLRLRDSLISTTGVLILTYEPAGALQTGSFALEEPTDLELERRQRDSRD
jgi:dihydrofolate reductase